MSRTLRLGFVMGGGVSLGTFCGAALSEAIKQQIVYGQYATGQYSEDGQPIYQPYDKVEIDVFSGASAGAISLGIMLRVLTNHQDKYSLLGYSSYKDFRQYLEEKLSRQFGGILIELKMKMPQKYEGLVAAQAVQEFQEKIWAKEVSLEKLLGVGTSVKDLSNTAGIIDRDVVDNLARDYFQFKSFSNRLVNRQLLADRVLFGCTLANLNYTIKAASNSTGFIPGNHPSLQKAMNDSSVARVHSELRVFDINFSAISRSQTEYLPLKWVQYHNGETMHIQQKDRSATVYNKTIKNINQNDIWREIAATTIASAAFPFAFEPVVLNRYRHEFGQDWAQELGQKEKHPFTYVDGGTFNNEPIREAMRLASFIDRTKQEERFDRRIVFVDPNVTELESQFRVDVHSQITVNRSFFSGKASISPKSTLMRLASKVPHMLTAVLNEAQQIESGKVNEIIDKFQKRDRMRDFYRSIASIQVVPPNEEIKKMRDFAIEELNLIREKLELPKNILQIQHEFIRIVKEEYMFFREYVIMDDKMVDRIQEFIYSPFPNEMEDVATWIYALQCLMVDLSFDLVGKTANARLIPIAPFDFYKNTGQDDSSYELMHLPGGGIAGFVGFASYEASQYEIDYGKYCAYRILKDLEFIQDAKQELPIPNEFDYSLFDSTLKSNVQSALLKRIKEILPSKISTFMPFLEGYIKDSLAEFVDANVGKSVKRQVVEFRICVPSDLFSLRGYNTLGVSSSKNRIQAIEIDGEFYLVTKLMYYPTDQKWKGKHVSMKQSLEIDKARLFDEKAALGILLPDHQQLIQAKNSPHPVFVLDARAALNVVSYSEEAATKWRFTSDIQALDEHLWGKDTWSETMRKL
ncbi:MAG: patatin-like phospholipase family protein [Saprospiraceae bacterium]|nr:patatin-like phospholipase family protein [Saprospiraceae bacterium]